MGGQSWMITGYAWAVGLVVWSVACYGMLVAS